MSVMKRAIQRFLRSQEGTIAITAALFMACTIAIAALAVDAASLYVERRRDQGAVDLAAMAAAANIQNAEQAVWSTLKANGIINPKTVKVVLGNYIPDPGVAADKRFRPNQLPTNAVKVTMVRPGRLHFGRVFTKKEFDIAVSALSACDNLAAFSIGSRLAGLQGGLANQLLGGLLGGNVSLTIMDYNSLAQANLSVLSFMKALAVETGVTAGTYSDVLNADTQAGDVVQALVHASQDSSLSASVAALNKLPLLSSNMRTLIDPQALISLGPLADLALGDSAPGLDATVNVLQMLTAAAAFADGDHQVSLDLGATIPGLLSVKADLAIGERPQGTSYLAIGAPGSKVYTAQTRLRVIAEVAGSGVLLGARIRVPIYVDLAYAEGELKSIQCASNSSGTVGVDARPGVANAWIGEVGAGFAQFAGSAEVRKAVLVDTGVIKATGRANVNIGSTRTVALTFTPDDISNHVIKQADTRDIVQSTVSRLVQNLQLDVQIVGINLGLGTQVSNLLGTILAGVAAPLDGVVNSLLDVLGVKIGQADVQVHGVRCLGNGALSG